MINIFGDLCERVVMLGLMSFIPRDESRYRSGHSQPRACNEDP
jgi:hypothetical protein